MFPVAPFSFLSNHGLVLPCSAHDSDPARAAQAASTRRPDPPRVTTSADSAWPDGQTPVEPSTSVIPGPYRTRAHANALVVAGARSGAVAYAQSVGADSDVCEAVRLAVSEAVTNVVMHAYQGMEQGDVLVEAWTTADGQLCVRVLDEGRGLIPRTDSPGLGIGFGLMAQMADDFRVSNRGEPGTVVSLRFVLAGA